MRNSLLILLLVCSFRPVYSQELFQLAPPLLKYPSVFFENKTVAEIKFAQEGTTVHYTLNGQEPTLTDPVYTGPVSITQNLTILKAKAFGAAFLPSETAVATFIKNGKRIKSLKYTLPHAAYPGNGEQTLIDNLGGVAQTGSKNWMGYQCDTVSIIVDLGKRKKVNSVLLHFLQSESAWIFLPEIIRIEGDNRKATGLQLLGTAQLKADKETTGTHCRYRQIKAIPKIKTRQLYITLLVPKEMPAWHAAKGQHAWIFIDELKIY
ncbi:MAG TPA: chitobiase/beta-hexosaminidase C-terminal domain-containing protein [Chitinophagaceae bacterium]|nr:chitobiase/beta-hexosaminidase C-terminal domain-containing protein [Chitinophagaceae bacterium]